MTRKVKKKLCNYNIKINSFNKLVIVLYQLRSLQSQKNVYFMSYYIIAMKKKFTFKNTFISKELRLLNCKTS